MSILSIPIYQSQISIAIYDSNFQEGKEYSLKVKKIRFRSLCHTIGSIALTIGMLEKVTDPYRGLQDYTKNTLVHFSVGITIRLLILHSWYLHSKRKMPLIQHFTFYSLHHDVKSQLCYTLVHIYTFFS